MSMSSKLHHHFAVAGLVLAFSVDARAEPEVLGADMTAQGGVSLAADTSNASITTNPGLLALNRRYDFSAQFGVGPSGGLHWAAGGMDGRTSEAVALGFMYAGDRYEPNLRTSELPGFWPIGEEIPNMKRQHDFVLALATPIVRDKLSVGLGGYVTYFNNDRDGKGATGNLDAGLGWKVSDYVTVGASGNNLLPFDPLSQRPLTAGAGVRVHGPVAAIEVDGGYLEGSGPGAPAFVAAGAELAPKALRIRGGYRYEGNVEQSVVTAGLGVFSEGGALEYGIDIPVGGSWGSLSHVIGVRFGAPPGIVPPE
jgi:hypothetical protein